MVRSGRHVLVFRCRKPIDPALSDPQEAMRLRDFLEEWRRSAIVSDYSTPEALQTSLLTNLTGLVDRLRRQEVSAEDGAPPIGERPTAVGCSIAERDEVTEINGSNVFQRRYSLALKNLTGTDLTAVRDTVRDGVRVPERVDAILLHLCQHQVHHRGQAHVQLQDAGIAPPQLDDFHLEYGRVPRAQAWLDG